jgi:hypothetical protein
MKPPRSLVTLVAVSLSVLACGGAETPATSPAPGPSSTPAPDVPAQPFYGGQDTIEIIVPFGEGGEADFFARFLAEHLQPHIPGGAGIRVVNLPGGDGIVGANEFANVRAADGLTMLLTRSSMFFSQAFASGTEVFPYDVRDWTPILAVPAGAMTSVRADTGITGVRDLAGFSGSLRFGGARPEDPGNLLHLLVFDLLRLDLDVSWGYAGTGALRAAFEQGEIDLRWTNAASGESLLFAALVEDGTAVPLFSAGRSTVDGVVRDPAQPELPHPGEVYEQLFGVSPAQGDPELWGHVMGLLGAQYTASTTLWVRSDTPEDAIRDLQAAVMSMARSEEFLSTRNEVIGAYEPVVDPVVLMDPAWMRLLVPDPATVEYVLGYMSDRFGIDIR